MRREWLDGAAIAALLFLCFVWPFPRWADWNQNSRFDLTVAIVDHGTLSIDCCVANTGDYAVYEGRTYTDKAPGLSFLAVPAYLLFEAVVLLPPVQSALTRLAEGDVLRGTLREGGTGLAPEKVHFFLGLIMATWLLVALPSALGGTVMYFFLARVTPRRGPRLAVTLAYALATSAFPYAGNFYAHQLAAVLLFTAFVLASGNSEMERCAPRGMARRSLAGRSSAPPCAAERRAPTESGLLAETRHGRLLAIGLLLGLAVLCELPAAIIAGPVALLAWWRSRDEPVAVAWLAAGAVVPLGLGAAYNWAIFGTPLPVGYRYSALWQARHAEGFFSLTYPRLATLVSLAFGPFRGLFFLSPVLLFAVPGFFLLWRDGQHRAELLVGGAAVLGFFTFNASSGMWWGGFAIGPRYLVPMLPFLAWPMVAVLTRPSAPVRALFAAAFVVSLLLVWALAWAEQGFPPDTIDFPLRDWAWPNLARGNLARNAGMMLGFSGWKSLLPLAAGIAGIAVSWRWLDRHI